MLYFPSPPPSKYIRLDIYLEKGLVVQGICDGNK